ncbi:stonustoxin subunit beta-like [Hoplias malabaricus]|uniref:stonustoxin subunit beta-like n=1 Tax=Hoplias malabaricus TaxID=27720 RepID=UPI0034625A76
MKFLIVTALILSSFMETRAGMKFLIVTTLILSSFMETRAGSEDFCRVLQPQDRSDRCGKGDSNLKVSALSRPLHLGMLYNALNDQLIPGFSLWKTEDIDKATQVRPQPSTRFQVAGSESLSEKTSLLEVSASIKLSLFCGLIEAGGSAHYLKSKTSSTHQCSVSLHYHKFTEFKELRISDLGSPNAQILEETDATHVVVGVLYGAEAIMEFQQTASNALDKKEIQGNLHVMIKKIPTVEISGDGSLKIDDDDKKKVQNFSCKFFGDFDLKENPSTFEEAVKVYKELPTLLGEKEEKAVPVKVWLYPLSRFNNTESKLKTMISEALVSEVEKVMDDFHQAEKRTNDLLEKGKEINAADLVDKLEQFQSSLRVFTVEFLKKMAALIPEIRGGTEEETNLKDLLMSLNKSGFSGREIKQWLDGKDTEIDVVIKYINKIQDYTIKPPGPELDSFLMDPDVTDALVFTFTSLKYEEPYLKKISQAAENFRSGSTSGPAEQDTTEELPWYKNEGVKEVLDSTLSWYNTINPSKRVISFISDPEHPGASIRRYKNTALKDPHVTRLTRSLMKKYACDVTLDPNTAYTLLSLSEGNRKLEFVWEDQWYPDRPERFDDVFQVLSVESWTGRCYWEVEWSGELVYISVSYGGIQRKGAEAVFGRNKNSWSLDCDGNSFTLVHNAQETQIPVPLSPSNRVGVYLDWEGDTLSFYTIPPNTHTLTHLHTLTTTFTEPLYAGFYVWDGSVRLCDVE